MTEAMSIHEAQELFLRDLKVGRLPRTALTYSNGLKRLNTYLASRKLSTNQDIAQLSVDHAIGFARFLSEDQREGQGLISKSSLRTYLTAVSRFYLFLLRESLLEIPAHDLERLREAYQQFKRGRAQPLPKLPPDEAIAALLSAARRVKPQPKKPRLDLARLRNIAMLEALRASGMRVGELVGLKRDDLDYRNHTARVTGKGDKQRVVYFDDAAWNAIQAYLQARNDGARGRALYQLPLFARHDRRASNKVLAMTTDSVRLVFNALARAAGIEIVMTPHSLRHAFATKVLEATGDLAVVQDMLGHASPATTRVYAKVSSKRMRDAHRAAFGYRGIDEN